MKNTNVISPQNTQEHIIDSYHFKVMSEFATIEEKKQKENTQEQELITNDEEENKEPSEEIQTQAVAQAPLQQNLVEDMFKEKEEMIDKMARLEMQVESQQKEFNSNLENAKEKFTQEGYNQAKAELEQEINDLKEKFLKSIAKLDEVSQNLESFIEKNEKELSSAAIEIAKEVINKEVEENSAQIALNLAKDLIKELKGAQNIELKVSPSDYDFIKSKLNTRSNLSILLDDAISKGSVVVLSDEGNIESNLNSRLTKIKKMASE